MTKIPNMSSQGLAAISIIFFIFRFLNNSKKQPAICISQPAIFLFRSLEIVIWNLFVIWDLLFGISNLLPL
jgi:hypothetical protein